MIDRLEEMRCHVYFVPHDVRARNDDIGAAREVSSRHAHSTMGVWIPESAAHAKALLSISDLVVSGRMHAAIAALSQGIPAVGIAYQDKFEGVFAQVGQQDCLVAEESHAGLASTVESVLVTKADRGAEINKHLPGVRRRAMSMLAGRA